MATEYVPEISHSHSLLVDSLFFFCFSQFDLSPLLFFVCFLSLLSLENVRGAIDEQFPAPRFPVNVRTTLKTMFQRSVIHSFSHYPDFDTRTVRIIEHFGDRLSKFVATLQQIPEEQRAEKVSDLLLAVAGAITPQGALPLPCISLCCVSLIDCPSDSPAIDPNYTQSGSVRGLMNTIKDQLRITGSLWIMKR